MDKKEEIRLIAYHIWEEEGCSNGRDVEHWLRAEAIWQEKTEQNGITEARQPLKGSASRIKKDRTVKTKRS